MEDCLQNYRHGETMRLIALLSRASKSTAQDHLPPRPPMIKRCWKALGPERVVDRVVGGAHRLVFRDPACAVRRVLCAGGPSGGPLRAHPPGGGCSRPRFLRPALRSAPESSSTPPHAEPATACRASDNRPRLSNAPAVNRKETSMPAPPDDEPRTRKTVRHLRLPGLRS